MDVNVELTNGTRELIKNAIEETKSNNRYVLCEAIAKSVETRYEGKSMDYQLKRMRINTTGRILDAIDTYFYSHI